MSKKRPTIKGKGAEIFLGEEETPKKAVSPSQQPTIKTAQGKATFYLPPSLLDRLDEVWLNLRRKNRKLRKSEIVRIALEKELSTYK